MHLDSQIGERLKALREEHGWSQQKAADMAGIRREMWAKYEAGSEPGARALAALASAGVDVTYLLTGQRHPLAPPPLNADEQELLALFRAAPLAVKAAAIGALQGAATGMALVQKGSGVQIGQVRGPVAVGAPSRRKGA